MRMKLLLATIAALAPAVASANETVTYGYDAKGRLVSAVHAGTVNNALQTTYTYDAADNRTQVTTTGAQRRVIVVPLGGLKVITLS